MSIVRVMRGGWVDRKSVPRGPNGRGLCRWCSLEVPKRRFTFCSEFCVHEWKLRLCVQYGLSRVRYHVREQHQRLILRHVMLALRSIARQRQRDV